jgi:hypothetical protein
MRETSTTEGQGASCGDMLAEGGRIVQLVLDGYLAEAWSAVLAGIGPCWTSLREAAVAILPALAG